LRVCLVASINSDKEKTNTDIRASVFMPNRCPEMNPEMSFVKFKTPVFRMKEINFVIAHRLNAFEETFFANK